MAFFRVRQGARLKDSSAECLDCGATWKGRYALTKGTAHTRDFGHIVNYSTTTAWRIEPKKTSPD